jgi:predicted ATPase
MKIQRAKFIGVRGVPDLTLDLTDTRTGEAHAVVVVSGPSGSGKTRMVEALIAAKEAIRPYGPMAAGAPWIGTGSAAKVRVTFYLDEAERDFAGTTSNSLEGEVIFLPDRANAEADDGLRALLGRYAHNPAYGKVDYFPADRRIPMFPPFPGLGSAEQRVMRLGKDTRKYGFILPFLRTLGQENAQRERFAASLAALSSSCRYIADPSGEVIPRCFSSHGGEPVTVAQLSHGESDAVIFAATATVIGLDHSLIFVDRPDLHAADLEQLVAGLASLGKDNQLFLTGRPEMAAAGHGAHLVNLKSG